jgi:hypothetical protein
MMFEKKNPKFFQSPFQSRIYTPNQQNYNIPPPNPIQKYSSQQYKVKPNNSTPHISY